MRRASDWKRPGSWLPAAVSARARYRASAVFALGVLVLASCASDEPGGSASGLPRASASGAASEAAEAAEDAMRELLPAEFAWRVTPWERPGFDSNEYVYIFPVNAIDGRGPLVQATAANMRAYYVESAGYSDLAQLDAAAVEEAFHFPLPNGASGEPLWAWRDAYVYAWVVGPEEGLADGYYHPGLLYIVSDTSLNQAQKLWEATWEAAQGDG